MRSDGELELAGVLPETSTGQPQISPPPVPTLGNGLYPDTPSREANHAAVDARMIKNGDTKFVVMALNSLRRSSSMATAVVPDATISVAP